MKNYKHIRSVCDRNSEFSTPVIDDFLIYFAADQHKLARQFDKRLATYRHITRDLPKEWLNRFKAQYIAHQIFKKEGLIRKYINHSGLQHFSKQEMEFLQFQKEHPWQFSFSQITGRPETDFFDMYDVFTDQEYLFFSPGITDILQTQHPLLWFNLISFNGECWQSYGPILHFLAFEPQDILFFAREVYDDWFGTGEEVMEGVEENPLPFSMLLSGSNSPVIFHDEHQIVINFSEYEINEDYNSELFRNDFFIEYSRGVYKLSPKGWNEFPHFSAAFYKEEDQLLALSSMTDAGYRYLVDLLNRLGYTLEYEPDDRVNLAMKATASDILKEELSLNPYEKLFTIDTPPEEQEDLGQMNAMLAELIPYVNSGEKPDFDALAAKYDVDPEMAKELYGKARKMVE
ncbi:MAG: hypothetical protein WD059_10575 [Balneolaceae bacterium]